jgi:3'-5' exoribonuclease
VRVQATSQFYSGALQLIAQRIERVSADLVDEGDFQTLNSIEVDRLAARLAELLRDVSNVHLRALAECFLMDEPLMDKFVRAPAGIKNHHAYPGGLLEHVVSLIELCAVVVPHYPDIDPDLLRLGAFLHDVGKIDELTYERELGYSDLGQLVGHLVIGVEILDRKIRESERLADEPFPETLQLRLKHMILSHHGQYEFGSPRLPMTLEALVLHFLDNLDAKVHAFGQIIATDVNTESNWTPYHPTLGRKLYKGPAPMDEPTDR